jgi:integrase
VGTTFPLKTGGLKEICTKFAQNNGKSPDRRVKFPVTIRHRASKAKIYRPAGKFRYYRVAYSAAGKRQMRTFADYSAAKAAAERLVREVSSGSQAATLSAAQSRDAIAAFERLQCFFQATGKRTSLLSGISEYCEAVTKLQGRTLSEAVEGYLRTVVSVKRKDIRDAVDEFCAERKPKTVVQPGKTRPTLNPTYFADTSRRLNEFADSLPGTAVCDLSKDHLNLFVGAHPKLTAKSRNHIRTTVRMFLGWCVTSDYLAANHRLFEASGLKSEELDDSPIDYYRPDELSKLLSNCSEQMRPIIALQALGGVRLQEALRLDWSEVFGKAGYIEISSSKSKTRQRRLVEICPALEKWLVPYRKKKGNVAMQTLNGYTAAFTSLRRSLKIPSRRNGLRHGFVTFHSALHQNEGMTASQAGNSPTMVHGHYRGLATKAEAEKWFNVVPTKVA